MNRVVLITGAARNTGYAIAQRFAKEGFDVVITSRTKADADAAAQRLMAEYPSQKVIGVAMDPAKPEEIRAAFAVVKETFGSLHSYISNAANLAVDYNIFNSTVEDWDAVMNANARGTFVGTQEAIKLMDKGGSIVYISSVHSKACIPGRVLYSTSKGALNSLMRSVAIEVGYLGIRVNCLIAGAIHTERWDNQDDALTEKRRANYPAGREAFGSEVAAGVYYLCSDEAAPVTGTEMTIDSGISDCLLPYQKGWRP